MDNSGEFSVFQFFHDGTYEDVLRGVDGETAVNRARNLTISVAGRLGTTTRVIITDAEDLTVFEWKFGEGVVFPPRESEAAAVS